MKYLRDQTKSKYSYSVIFTSAFVLFLSFRYLYFTLVADDTEIGVGSVFKQHETVLGFIVTGLVISLSLFWVGIISETAFKYFFYVFADLGTATLLRSRYLYHNDACQFTHLSLIPYGTPIMATVMIGPLGGMIQWVLSSSAMMFLCSLNRANDSIIPVSDLVMSFLSNSIIVFVSIWYLFYVKVRHGKEIASLETKQIVDEAMKKAATAESENKYKTEFLSRVSHELKTPLAVMTSATERLLDKRQMQKSGSFGSGTNSSHSSSPSRNLRSRVRTSRSSSTSGAAEYHSHAAHAGQQLKVPRNGNRLNSPMITMNEDMFEMTPNDHASVDNVDHWLGVQLESCHLLKGLLDNVLVLHRIETGQQTLSVERFRFRSLVADLARILSVSSDLKGVDFVMHIAENVAPEHIGDVVRIRQIMMNLASNAIRFCDSGHVKITVEACQDGDGNCFFHDIDNDTIYEPHETLAMHEKEKNGLIPIFSGTGGTETSESSASAGTGLPTSSSFGHGSHIYANTSEYQRIKCIVEDTGVGMSPQKLASILDQEVTTVPERGGTGLGLKIVQKLVELMDGSLQCESEEGVGSTFIAYMNVPVCDFLVESPHSSSVSYEEDEPSRTVLLVEDNTHIQALIGLLLASKGHFYDAVENGKKGLELYIQNHSKYDIVLMDVRMPVMNGLEATKEIRLFEALHGLATKPILALTAHSLQSEIKECFNAGVSGYLPKPVDKEILLDAIATLGETALQDYQSSSADGTPSQSPFITHLTSTM